jgi:hypothetical protein
MSPTTGTPSEHETQIARAIGTVLQVQGSRVAGLQIRPDIVRKRLKRKVDCVIRRLRAQANFDSQFSIRLIKWNDALDSTV